MGIREEFTAPWMPGRTMRITVEQGPDGLWRVYYNDQYAALFGTKAEAMFLIRRNFPSLRGAA